MKIEKDNTWKLFDEIEYGECFITEGCSEIFLKCYPSTAVRLDDGELIKYSRDDDDWRCKQVNAKVIIVE